MAGRGVPSFPPCIPGRVFNAILRSFPSGMTFRAVSKEATKLTISFSKPPVPSVDVSLYQTARNVFFFKVLLKDTFKSFLDQFIDQANYC